MEKGDLVEYFDERGVICHDDPFIMKTLDFHSYVPIQNIEMCFLISKSFEIDCSIKKSIVERIKKYLKEKTYVQKTGE